MSLLGRVSKLMGNINSTSMEAAGVVGKIANKVLKKVPDVIEGGAGIADKSINAGKKFVGKVKDGSVKKAVTEGIGKVSRDYLSDDSSYRYIKGITGKEKNIGISKKSLIMDDLNRRGKQFVNNGAAIWDTITKEEIVVNGVKTKNPLQLIKKNEESLLGYKANKRGVLLAATGMTIMGIPEGAKQFIDDRKGINPDGQITTSAPRIPAYAQDGGATGDLVFALNNLRHGGMM